MCRPPAMGVQLASGAVWSAADRASWGFLFSRAAESGSSPTHAGRFRERAKRCVRAAFEREHLRTRLTSGDVTSGDVTGANANGRGAIGGVYTRDLYHCAGLASDARPELGEDLAAALCAAVHGPRAVWGALWYACGGALCVRLRDAIAYDRVGPR